MYSVGIYKVQKLSIFAVAVFVFCLYIVIPGKVNRLSKIHLFSASRCQFACTESETILNTIHFMLESR